MQQSGEQTATCSLCCKKLFPYDDLTIYCFLIFRNTIFTYAVTFAVTLYFERYEFFNY